MKFQLALALTAVVLLASCSNSEMLIRKTNAHDAITEVNATGMVMRPIVADLDIDADRKSNVYSGDVKLPMADLKQNAIAAFKVEHGCEYIVDATFETTRKLKRKVVQEIIITVSGFPAQYTNLYQVDSLPKSIGQYARLMKNEQRVDYLNEITVKEDLVGLEFSAGNYMGLQVDFPVTLGGLETRAFVAIDGYGDESMPDNIAVSINSSTNADVYTSNGYIDEASSFAFGIMHQIPASKKANFRLVGGLNIDSYSFSDISEPGGSVGFDSAALVGLRLGGGMDLKIFRSLYGVGKLHKNVSLLRVIGKDGVGDIDIADFEVEGTNNWNFGVGLRFVF